MHLLAHHVSLSLCVSVWVCTSFRISHFHFHFHWKLVQQLDKCLPTNAGNWTRPELPTLPILLALQRRWPYSLIELKSRKLEKTFNMAMVEGVSYILQYLLSVTLQFIRLSNIFLAFQFQNLWISTNRIILVLLKRNSIALYFELHTIYVYMPGIIIYPSIESNLLLILSSLPEFLLSFLGGLSKLHTNYGGALAGSPLRLWHQLISAHVQHVCDQRQQLYPGGNQKWSSSLSLWSATQFHLSAGG